MRTPFRKAFSDPKRLQKMLSLRKGGWGYISLADLYGVDVGSIYPYCKGDKVMILHKGHGFSLSRVVSVVVKPRNTLSYIDYLKKAYPNRRWVEKNYT